MVNVLRLQRSMFYQALKFFFIVFVGELSETRGSATGKKTKGNTEKPPYITQ